MTTSLDITAFNPAFNFYQVLPGIFLLEMGKREDLALSFLRAQEFYESANPDIQGHCFTLDTYRQWYSSQSKTGDFSYATDWSGFNLPSHAIKDCYALHDERLPTDEFFLEINAMCERLIEGTGLESYYLLGVRGGDTKTLEHEVAHGLYSTNPQYKKTMDLVLSNMSPKKRAELFDCLHTMGYSPTVHADEAQAFLATGLSRHMTHLDLEETSVRFAQVFKAFAPNCEVGEPIIAALSAASE